MCDSERFHCEASKWWLESFYNKEKKIIEYIRRPIRDTDWMTPEQLKIRDENHSREDQRLSVDPPNLW